MKKTSNSENLILQLFWKHQCRIACSDIYKMVREIYPNKWKDSSVSVFLIRMEEKELIKKEEINGTMYWISVSKGQYFKSSINSAFMKSMKKSYDEIFLGFIEDPDKQQAFLDEIDAVIKKYEDVE